MSNINFLKPDRTNLNTFLYLGSFLFFISILDVFLNSFFRLNLTGFLPNFLSFLLPLLLGFVGLYFIRIEYSGIKNLDLLNKHINTNNFNAVLSLLIIFIIIKSLPPILSWFVIDASFAGDSKDVCTGSGACWTYIKVWMRRFMYGMYPNAEQWRINLSFVALVLLGSVGYFATDKFKKYLTLYYVVIYPLIAFLFIFFFISGGPVFFDFSYGIIAAILSIIIGFFIPSKFKFYYFLIVPLALYVILKYFLFFEEYIELGKLDGLNWVETGAWGGLSLTFIISFFCLIFCFPIGMAFALGRRSSFPPSSTPCASRSSTRETRLCRGCSREPARIWRGSRRRPSTARCSWGSSSRACRSWRPTPRSCDAASATSRRSRSRWRRPRGKLRDSSSPWTSTRISRRRRGPTTATERRASGASTSSRWTARSRATTRWTTGSRWRSSATSRS